jgi:hypothetical protein
MGTLPQPKAPLILDQEEATEVTSSSEESEKNKEYFHQSYIE